MAPQHGMRPLKAALMQHLGAEDVTAVVILVSVLCRTHPVRLGGPLRRDNTSGCSTQ